MIGMTAQECFLRMSSANRIDLFHHVHVSEIKRVELNYNISRYNFFILKKTYLNLKLREQMSEIFAQTVI